MVFVFQQVSILGTRGGDEAEEVQEDGLYAIGVPRLCEGRRSGEVWIAIRR